MDFVSLCIGQVDDDAEEDEDAWAEDDGGADDLVAFLIKQ